MYSGRSLATGLQGARNTAFQGDANICIPKSRRAAAGRAQLLAKKGHTGRVQNPAKVSENRPACGTAQHTLAVCFVFEKLEKSRKNLVKIWRKFSKILAKFGQILRNLRKNQQKFQQFLTKILRLEIGAKECIM